MSLLRTVRAFVDLFLLDGFLLSDFIGRLACFLAILEFLGFVFAFLPLEGMAAVYHRISSPAVTPQDSARFMRLEQAASACS